MRGYIDSTAGEIVAGDTLLDPMSGVLCRVTSVEAPENGLVAIHMIGSVSLSYMGLSVKPERPIRRAPRGDEAPVSAPQSVPVRVDAPVTYVPSQMCACGFKTRAACAELCLKG